ncbi:hypothetical protein [Planctomicrobium piriforme]|uniref:Uncharacterized protein n=1 Tax=Planctomicrobium piriforme TaxID=1576369 RepID=A0A1I3AXP5_9PLAN|nr:hypothetical protein [Planctomicrobium piriforme]SFH54576.1 hypothetical protein SAMN05421753_101102 [Planctomicrobium piriforme]
MEPQVSKSNRWFPVIIALLSLVSGYLGFVGFAFWLDAAMTMNPQDGWQKWLAECNKDPARVYIGNALLCFSLLLGLGGLAGLTTAVCMDQKPRKVWKRKM